MKRSGAFPANIDTPPLDCSDSTDDQQDGTPVPTPTSKLADSATPHRKKMWRRKRRQSNSKDEKPKESGFLEKIQNSDRLARRQSLPPLLTLQMSHDLDQNASTSTLLDEAGLPDGVSRDSTPRPKNPDTPITPNGSFSPEVSELIESVRHPIRHRRNDSNGSIRMHRRQGSNGSVASNKGPSLEATPLRGTNPSTAASSKRASMELSQLSFSSSRRGSGSAIPYSKMDTTDSESNTEQPAKALTDDVRARDGGRGLSPQHALGHAKDMCSNESSMDTHESSMDTHESDGEGNEADGESTSDGYEKRFDRFSGTEPNETTTESNFESSAASPSQAESDELSSSDVINLIPRTHSKACPVPSLPIMSSSPLGLLGTGQSHDLSHDKFSCETTLSNYYSSSMTTPTMGSTTYHGNHQVAMLVSQFEHVPPEDSDVTPETSLTDLQTGLMSIPVHIRRQSVERQEDGTSGSATPTSGRLGSVTAIVRTFFENMSSKPKRVGLHNQDSGEFEDSGFQVSIAVVL